MVTYTYIYYDGLPARSVLTRLLAIICRHMAISKAWNALLVPSLRYIRLVV